MTIEQPIFLTLPSPPSVNHYWRHTKQGRHYISDEGKQFKNAVYAACFEQLRGFDPDMMLKRPVSLAYAWYRPARRGDLDNIAKVTLDSLIGILYADDAQVWQSYAVRYDDKDNPRLELVIAWGADVDIRDLMDVLLD